MAEAVSKQVYDEQGFATPLEVVATQEMERHRAAFDRIEAELGHEAAQVGVQNAHLEHVAI